MPISQKIKDEIQSLDATPNEKALILKILELEDGGLRNYTAPYEKEIAAFIEKEDRIGGENS